MRKVLLARVVVSRLLTCAENKRKFKDHFEGFQKVFKNIEKFLFKTVLEIFFMKKLFIN